MVAAAVIASNFRNMSFPMIVEALGGSAEIRIDEDGYAHMVGPAEYVSI